MQQIAAVVDVSRPWSGAGTEKLVDVVGRYLNPPERAVVLSIDEKSQIQALDRTQPGACR